MTAYYAEYWKATGQLQREGPGPLKSESGELAVVTFDVAPDRAATDWSPMTLSFDPRPPVVAVLARPIVSKLVFLRDRIGFAALTLAMARRATDPRIDVFKMLIDNADVIHLDDPSTIGGINYLQTLDIISADDVARILAPSEG